MKTHTTLVSRTLTAGEHVAGLTKRCLVAALAMLSVPAVLSAQTTLQWSASGGTNFGGSGNWNLTESLWWNGASAQTWPASGTNNLAVFGGSNGIVTLTEGVAANLLRFATNGYVVSGAQTLTLNGSAPGVQVVGGTNSAALGGNTALVLGGTAGLAKTGAGTAVLNGSAAHIFTGGVNVQRGTLEVNLGNLASPTSVFDTNNVLTLGGGTLNVTGKAAAAGGQTFASTTLNTGTSQLRSATNAAGSTNTVRMGTITRAEPGAVVLLNPSAATAVFGGTSSATERIFISGAANAWFGSWAFNGQPTSTNIRWAFADGAGQIRVATGVGITANLDNVTNPASVYTIASGTTQNLTGNRVGLGFQTTAFQPVLNLGANDLTLGGLLALFSNTTNTINATTGRLVIGGSNEFVSGGIGVNAINAPVANNGTNVSHVTHIGAGTLTLNGTNTYTGQTTVNGGVMALSSNGVINTSTNVVLNGGEFRQNNPNTAFTVPVTVRGGRLSGLAAVSSTVTVSDGLGGSVGNLSNTTLTVADLVYQGAGAFDLNIDPTNTAVVVSNTLTTPPTAGAVILNINPAGGWQPGTTVYNLIGYQNWGGSLSNFTFGTFGSAVSPRQSLTLGTTGPTNGVITLTVTSGDKALWTGAASSAWTTNVIGSPFNWKTEVGGVDTEFISDDAVVFNDTAANPNVDITTASVAVISAEFDNSSLEYVVGSTGGFGISSGSVTKSGSAKLTLGGSNTYTGATTVNGGTLAAGSATAFQGNSVVTLAAGTTFDLNGFDAAFPRFLDNASSSVVNNGAGAGTNTLRVTTPTNSIAALVTDGPTRKTLVQMNGGWGVLNGDNTFSGGFVIAGDVTGITRNRYAPSTNVTVAGGVVTKGVYGTGPIVMGTNTADRAQFYFAGATNLFIANDIIVNTSLGSDTAGTFRVESLNNSLSGTIQANLGTVVFAHNGQFSGGPGSVTVSGPVISGTSTNAGLTVQQQNVGTTNTFTVTLSNTGVVTNSYNGPTTIASSTNVTLRIAADNQIPDGTGRGNVVFSSSARLDLNGFSDTVNGISGTGIIDNIAGAGTSVLTVGAGDATASFAGPIRNTSGTVALVKTGAGTQTLTGTNTYSGGTTVNAGVLAASTTSLPGDVQIATAGTLRFDQETFDTFNGVISGNGTLVKAGFDTLVLGATNTFTGNIILSLGDVEVAEDAAISFAVGGSGTNNAVSGVGNLTVNGQFIIDLSAASTGNGDSWALVTAPVTYGTNFLVAGFNGSGGLWTNTTNGVDYVFSESLGTLTVQGGPPTNSYDSWVTAWQGVYTNFTSTNGASDPDGDGFVNNLEFAFDGNPMVGSPSLLTATKSGTNAVFQFVGRKTGVDYTVKSTTNLVTGPWASNAVTASIVNLTNTNGVNFPADYTRKEFTVPAAGKEFFRVEANFAP